MAARRVSACILVLTLIGFYLRGRGLFFNTFHGDEALFAGYARTIAVWRDPLLLRVADPVDKPPLLFYLQALFYPIQGPVMWAARLPNWIGGILLTPLVGRIVWRETGSLIGVLLACCLLTFSPLGVQFTPTAFTDMLLTVWLTIGLSAAMRGKKRWSFWLGVGLVTKYQAILFAPLFFGLWWRGAVQITKKELFAIMAGFCIPLLLLAAWDFGPDRSFDLVSRQWTGYGGLRLAWRWELLDRLRSLLVLLWTGLGPAGWTSILVCLLLFVLRGAEDRPYAEAGKKADQIRHFSMIYLLLHWLVAVPLWDRYFLPLVPLAAVAAGIYLSRTRFLEGVLQKRPLQLGMSLLLIIFLWQGGLARAGYYPVGGGVDADDGAARVATGPLLADAPAGTVLYDHWYSWQWRYHLFDTAVYVSWFPHSAALIEDLDLFYRSGQPRYIALPLDQRGIPVVQSLNQAGYKLERVDQAGKIGVYAIRK